MKKYEEDKASIQCGVKHNNDVRNIIKV